MKYEINRTNHSDFSVLEINKRAPRAYSIPYSSMATLSKTPYEKERISSDMVHLLSGEWDFKYYAKNTFLPKILDSSKIRFDSIKVPSTWQRIGYEPPVYLNCPYEIETKPPKVPDEMSVGVYRKSFCITNSEKKYILSFLGVVPCIDLYVNGKFVGYSEGAHNTAEFDITDYVSIGENELLAVVHKWSSGTFVECQDMFRENGIFRDVLLYEMPLTYINDYFLKTSKGENGWCIDAAISMSGNTDGYSVEINLTKDGKVIASNSNPAENEFVISFKELDVIEWNAEVPTVYEAYITLKNNGNEVQTIRNYTGFKSVHVDGDVFFFNDAAIKVKGVNHHDTNEKTGYVMSFYDIQKDILLMKEYNVNAVRTSHYPPDPQFLTLCDIYGLYVIDEADIETHGAGCAPHFNINLISNNIKWAPRYVDRVKRMYYRDRNHPSIMLWSLGNEAGGWKCQDACYEFLHEIAPEIPVHYEGACRTPRHAYDVFSEMYTHPDKIAKIRDNKAGKEFKNKPFYLCEYCHAMGVGPGALEDYWQLFYSSDKLMGGCIWEWADHAVYHSDGKLKYTYGGDHGERKHDGNFCVDGLFYPNRTPHTGAKEMKAVYRPLRAKYLAENTFEFTNTNRFRNADYISIDWEFLKNAEPIANGKLSLDIAATEHKNVKIDLPAVDSENDYYVNFTYSNECGGIIAVEQVTLVETFKKACLPRKSEMICKNSESMLEVTIENIKINFNKSTGALESYCVGDNEILNQSPANGIVGFVPNIFRASLDNDVRKKENWIKLGFDKCSAVFKSFSFGQTDKGILVTTTENLKCARKNLFTCVTEYMINMDTTIDVKASLVQNKAIVSENDLPRFGLMIELPEKFENINYYGLGDCENLCDFHAQSKVGIYSTSVDAMNEPYIKPQDNGNRGKVRWLKVTDNNGIGIEFCSGKNRFSFSAHHYTQKLLQGAKHREDLKNENTTALCIDAFCRGTGTASCGPDTLSQYTFDVTKDANLEFTIVPIV